MAATSSVGNGTTIMNTTEAPDNFCVKLFVGPLIWAVFSVPCACVGVPASVWLLWVLIQRQRSGSFNTNIYMLNLTIMDLIYNILKLPELLNFFVWRDLTVSSTSYFFESVYFNGRPLFMACSCVDCYMAVVHPISYMRIRQSRYRAVVCVLVWVSMLVFAWLLLFVVDYSVNSNVWQIPCVLAISTITVCDIILFRTLRKPDPSGRTAVHPQKQRALQTIINSFVMTLVSFLPLMVFRGLMEFIPLSSEEVQCHIAVPCLIFSMLGSTILPLLYLRNLVSWIDLRVCG